MIEETKAPITRQQVSEVLKKGSRFIAPLWSLENFVAVNSYMGMADMPFFKAMDFLHKTGDTSGTLPIAFYQQALKSGQISSEDIALALNENSKTVLVEEGVIMDHILGKDESGERTRSKTYADVASEHSKKEWNRFMIDRISIWASAYFDDKQAIWNTSSGKKSIFAAWKEEAEVDLSPEVMGLRKFHKHLSALPDNYLDAVALALDELEIPVEMLEFYFNSLLMKMNGWAGFAARLDWEAGLNGEGSHALEEFLAIMIVWDMLIKKVLDSHEINHYWWQSKRDSLEIIAKDDIDGGLASRLIFQQAFDLAHQRAIIQKLNRQEKNISTRKPAKAQAVFCIDVRSEVMRRNLEAVDDEVETIGFAGFFGFPVNYVPLGYDQGQHQGPVLITTSHTVKESIQGSTEIDKAVNKRLQRGHLTKAIKAFKKGAISCFSFVSPLGLFFLPKLLSDSFGLTRPVVHPRTAGLDKATQQQLSVDLTFNAHSLNEGIPLAERIKMALGALKGMSLTENFAPIILIAGHGSTTTNNPHATGLDCGACGGNSGEANAKVAVAILNNPAVRAGIAEQGIDIPNTTLFVAALHDTTTDVVKLFRTKSNFETPKHREQLKELNFSLELAGEKTRAERAKKMNLDSNNVDKAIIQRSKDWSQVRPEWGLAGCSSFIVAPRERTSELDLGGKSFLHNYSWKKDHDFSILELIMTAPMVVTSWINLQYYASTVDNKVFGAGNKTLHNVVGGVGVLEGFAGDLRAGLPLQSVNDGEKFQHEPLRLKVFIEAPVDEMSKILNKHEGVRNLCDNEWIYLFAINDEGKPAYKYVGDLQWEVIN